MFEYDDAQIEMYKGATYAPLISWDISCKHVYGAINTGQEMQFLKNLEKDLNWSEFPELRLPLLHKKAVIVTNLQREIIWVSRRFFHLTGYLPSEVLGRTPNFLQGAATCKQAMGRIRENLRALQPVSDELVNYRKDGQAYLCKLEIYPVFDKSHTPVNFVAIESAG